MIRPMIDARGAWMLKRLALVVAGLVLVTGVAWAAIPDTSGVIHGCYLTSGNPNVRGALRVIDTEAGETCGSGETAIQWSQTGPQGPTGPTGPQGPAGTTVSYINTFPPAPLWSSLFPGVVSAVSGNCDAEDIAVGTGLELQDESSIRYLRTAPSPISTYQWRIVLWSEATSISFRVATKCLDLPPLR